MGGHRILESGKENGLKPFGYLRYLFTEARRCIEDLDEFSPWSETILAHNQKNDCTYLCHFRVEVLCYPSPALVLRDPTLGFFKVRTLLTASKSGASLANLARSSMIRCG